MGTIALAFGESITADRSSRVKPFTHNQSDDLRGQGLPVPVKGMPPVTKTSLSPFLQTSVASQQHLPRFSM